MLMTPGIWPVCQPREVRTLGIASWFFGNLVYTRTLLRYRKKVERIDTFLAPSYLDQFRRFLNVLNFCRRFISEIAEGLLPLSAILLCKHDHKNRWITLTFYVPQSFAKSKQILADQISCSSCPSTTWRTSPNRAWFLKWCRRCHSWPGCRRCHSSSRFLIKLVLVTTHLVRTCWIFSKPFIIFNMLLMADKWSFSSNIKQWLSIKGKFSRYVWPCMNQDVQQRARACMPCQLP